MKIHLIDPVIPFVIIMLWIMWVIIYVIEGWRGNIFFLVIILILTGFYIHQLFTFNREIRRWDKS